MKQQIAIAAASVSLLVGAAPPPAVHPEIVTGDVDRFYAVYDAADGNPTAEQLQREVERWTEQLRSRATIDVYVYQ